ncbi:chromosome partitioning protein [Novosphingobium chloroacetimidivorans]|uniref:Chromosome partitioning protein n=1 Tax=Novosphingobium chloroacetimidivorans TaxID=1428314 RepID=A0A7W7KDU0_9SPHN|nr:ParA family protein [Novosphingobium chloroacetimidivorans]MBB4861014.1 chromosome partitioning protein [Novosphingobium chloroacetimidivorans]
MPVISMISPKGGVGKTTAAVVLATELAASHSVTIIDADPNQPVKTWAELGRHAARLKVIAGVNQENITDAIEAASAESVFVVVDVEGTASLTAAYAVGMSDFVLVPCQGSTLDARQATKALKIIRDAGRLSGGQKPHAILFTKTNPAIRTRNLTHVARQLTKAGIPALDTELNEREAFRSIFSFGGGLSDLDPSEVANLDKAKANAKALAKEVMDRIKEVISS